MEEQIENNINGYLEKLKNIRENEFKNNNFEYSEYVKKEKVYREKRIDTIEHQKKMRKQALINLNKSARKEIEEFVTITEDAKDILTDELFYVKKEEVKEETKRVRKKFEDITRDELLILLEKYFLKKKIKLNREDMNIWTTMKNDGEVEWRKYLSISLDGTEITKISFFKKNVYGDDIIDFTEEEKLTSEERKIQEKRRKMLNKF